MKMESKNSYQDENSVEVQEIYWNLSSAELTGYQKMEKMVSDKDNSCRV